MNVNIVWSVCARVCQCVCIPNVTTRALMTQNVLQSFKRTEECMQLNGRYVRIRNLLQQVFDKELLHVDPYAFRDDIGQSRVGTKPKSTLHNAHAGSCSVQYDACDDLIDGVGQILRFSSSSVGGHASNILSASETSFVSKPDANM